MSVYKNLMAKVSTIEIERFCLANIFHNPLTIFDHSKNFKIWK